MRHAGGQLVRSLCEAKLAKLRTIWIARGNLDCPPKAVLIRAHAQRGRAQNHETGAEKTRTCTRKTHPCLLRLAPAGTALVPAKTKRGRICSPVARRQMAQILQSLPPLCVCLLAAGHGATRALVTPLQRARNARARNVGQT